MKKTIKTLTYIVLCTGFLCSCHKDLNIKYSMTMNSSTMWKDPSDLVESVHGIYKRLRDYFSNNECNIFYLGEVRVGDSMWGASLESKVQDNFKIACRHNTLDGSSTIGWSGLYSAIDQANAVLKYADKCRASEEQVEWARAQAYFARAYSYFWAGRIWGYCPVNLVPIESNTQPECYPDQKTPAEVFEQVKSDIAACELLAKHLKDNKYFATEDALMMLKAEFGLWMYREKNAGAEYLDLAQEAIKSIGISPERLLSDYGSVFSRTNKINPEIIFALNNTATSAAGYQVYFCHPANLIDSKARCDKGGPVPISSTQWWSYPQSFVDRLKASQAAGDTRVATNLGYGPYAAGDKHEISWCNKLLGDMSKAPVVLDNDLIYYRYAYAVMLDAEIKYYKGDYQAALSSLNLIAKRAYGTDKYTDKSEAAVRKALIDEYTLEFPAEGMLWFALIRIGVIWDIAPNSEQPDITFAKLKEKNPNILLWPIANSSINKNPGKISQIKGWS